MGLVDPVSLAVSMERYARPEIKTVMLAFGTMYDRTLDRPEVVAKTLDLVEDLIREPVKGLMPRLQRLRRYAQRWSGEAHADALVEAFAAIHEALDLRKAVAPQFHAFYHGVTMRYLTRPLLIKPEVLTPDEEAYFLPYVFNPDLKEAREDYTDFHGGRMEVVPLAAPFHAALAKLRTAAAVLESAEGSDAEWMRRAGQGFRVWASLMRSCHNFYFGQAIRDRNRELLSGPPRTPPKVASWDGHPDILEWNELMRDEIDNTHELIALLEKTGQDLVYRAPTAELEDMFVLGPDLLGALRQKAKIMRAHWRDAEAYFYTPHK
jgi:hypothetical protein